MSEAIHQFVKDLTGKKSKEINPGTHEFSHSPKDFHRQMLMAGYDKVKDKTSINTSHHGMQEHHTHHYTDGTDHFKVVHNYSGGLRGGYNSTHISHVGEGPGQHSEEESTELIVDPGHLTPGEAEEVLKDYPYIKR